MTLRLSIENVDRLPDGGPLRIEVKGRGIDLGRDAHLDWTLPDPSRSVSAKHCEIRYRDGGYWLHDVSTNGTFVNGAEYRLDAPYLLRNGDRLAIGPYLIAVAVEGREALRRGGAASELSPADVALGDVWGPIGPAAAPETARQAVQKRSPPPPDFLDFASFLAPPSLAPEAPGPASSPEGDWMTAPRPAARVQAPAVEAPAPRIPTPARPAEPELQRRPVAEAPLASPERSDALRRIAIAAGIPEGVLAARSADELADDIGAVIRMTVDNLARMLASRAESKTLMRSSSRTMIRAVENNPLKFAPSTEEALGAMFGPRTRNYLDARETIERSFGDLKSHQLLTFGAMQGALDALFEDLAPEKIDRSVGADHGLGALISSRKAKLWDIYVERWRAKTKRADGRLLEAFMGLFAEVYDRLQDKTK